MKNLWVRRSFEYLKSEVTEEEEKLSVDCLLESKFRIL